ncbi:MAG TPA: HD domain-containing protein [Solirubrobacteraceae bacterium]|nr:HD domain-containing protein [Solirubrobacteraceae bacterium]
MSATAEPTVATLRADDEVDAIFACTRKERQISRTGSPYLTVELRDSSGAIIARAFRDADVLAGRFERGELVRVRGRVRRFRDELQIEARTISRAEQTQEEDPTRFLPTAYRDLDELEGFLEHLAREVYDPALSALLSALLEDRELRAQIRLAPCSAPARVLGAQAPSGGGGAAAAARAHASHHAYLGGLLEHTVAVATLALELCTLHPRLDRDLLMCAAIVHDLGKTREFSYGAEIERSREGRLLGHIQLGLRVLAERMPASLDGERRLALEHCVMLHHGPDTASGQRFGSAEALALYRLNALDGHVKGALEHGAFAAAA